MTINYAGGLIQDIFDIGSKFSCIGGTLRIGSGNVSNANDIENLQVLNVYPLRKIIRVLRHTGSNSWLGSNIDVLNNQISIPVQTRNLIQKQMILSISTQHNQSVLEQHWCNKCW